MLVEARDSGIRQFTQEKPKHFDRNRAGFFVWIFADGTKLLPLTPAAGGGRRESGPGAAFASSIWDPTPRSDPIRQLRDNYHIAGRLMTLGWLLGWYCGLPRSRVALGACSWVVILSLNNFCEARPE
jgi:hypothetical protein